tara:strand:+ start:2499 stop:3020 length:522 start_codon:yes stop_codon:yes gene_type:complete
MATEEKEENLEQKPPQPEVKKEEKAEEKPTYMFPHQLLLTKLNIKESDLDQNSKEYIGDFNDFLKHVKMAKASAKKKGNEYVLPESKKNKLLRLSKSVCQSMQTKIDEDENKKMEKIEAERRVEQRIEEKRMAERKRREFLSQRREDAMNQRRAEEEKKKEEEKKDDSIGWFW